MTQLFSLRWGPVGLAGGGRGSRQGEMKVVGQGARSRAKAWAAPWGPDAL